MRNQRIDLTNQIFGRWRVLGPVDQIKGAQLDRIDNNSNYEPENCRWVTCKNNANNRRNNRILTLNGRSQTLQQWADELKLNRKTISTRIDKYGWSIEDSLKK